MKDCLNVLPRCFPNTEFLLPWNLSQLAGTSSGQTPPHQKSEAIYEIPCSDCPKSNIGETGRSFGTRLQEHQKQVEIFHNIQWDAAKVTDSESDKKETIWIYRKGKYTLNKDDGAYKLNNIFD